jgi:hypothetical protein
MTTFLIILLAIIISIMLLSALALFWLRSKLRNTNIGAVANALTATVTIATCKEALGRLKDKIATPEYESNHELVELVARLNAAHTEANSAFENRDFDKAIKIVVPLMEELTAYRDNHPEIFETLVQEDSSPEIAQLQSTGFAADIDGETSHPDASCATTDDSAGDKK